MASIADYIPPVPDGSSRRTRLADLAARLAEISAELQHAGGEADDPCAVTILRPSERSGGHAAANLLELARHAYWLRRQRAQIFGCADLFGEPAWDILLDLYIAQGDGKAVSVSSACIGSASPPTTGLRWLAALADKGLILREPDAHDHRRIMVRLTAEGSTAVERFLMLARQAPL